MIIFVYKGGYKFLWSVYGAVETKLGEFKSSDLLAAKVEKDYLHDKSRYGSTIILGGSTIAWIAGSYGAHDKHLYRSDMY